MLKPILSLLLSLMLFVPGFSNNPSQYICPPCGAACDSLVYEEPGICPHCHMPLIRKEEVKTIAFYLQDGVEVLDFAGPLEVFSYAGYRVFTVSKSKNPIKSQGVLKVTPDYSIEDAPKADVLAFFGGNAASAYKDPAVIDWIKKQVDTDYYFSVCTGAFLLAESGILDGQTATTFHDALDNLEENYPTIDVRKDVRFVDNGKVVTTAGISAGIDGALHLVAKFQGLTKAKRTAFYMEYDNWVPGDGLILTEEDPYEFLHTDFGLSDYTGVFEYKEGATLEFVLVDHSPDLHAIIKGVKFPLFFESENIFSDVDGDLVYFERDSVGKVRGYRIQKEGVLFKKIKE
ncbi:DJ-1/PfpI family protein [Algoriphagus halophilus]|uniref:DJ-1/PfpI family protein n=1 Tax=Algoriphagus halophilus TaxID=226505 RepID=UPI00358EA02F